MEKSGTVVVDGLPVNWELSFSYTENRHWVSFAHGDYRRTRPVDAPSPTLFDFVTQIKEDQSLTEAAVTYLTSLEAPVGAE